MTLFVDFNMAEADGSVPAVLLADQVSAATLGTQVIAADGEGTECVAVVTDVSPDGRLATLSPVPGTWNRQSTITPPIGDLIR